MIYEDSGASGAVRERSGLAQALARMGAGDVLAVWKLDRLGRSLPHLIELLDGLGRSRFPVPFREYRHNHGRGPVDFSQDEDFGRVRARADR